MEGAKDAARPDEGFEGSPVVGVEGDGGAVVGFEQAAELGRGPLPTLRPAELGKGIGERLLIWGEQISVGVHAFTSGNWLATMATRSGPSWAGVQWRSLAMHSSRSPVGM